jgi:hypothetical protein
MEALRKEIEAWGNINWEVHESMLRGCVGLDVTAFFLMILVRMFKVLEQNFKKTHASDDAMIARAKSLHRASSCYEQPPGGSARTTESGCCHS